MCFTIDRNAKRPKARIAYKVVRITDGGYVRSPFKSNTLWSQGGVKKIRKNAKTILLESAHEGIYVVFSLNKLLNTIKQYPKLAVLALSVDPKDWLFSSKASEHLTVCACIDMKGLGATYRRVKVARIQPQIQWVD